VSRSSLGWMAAWPVNVDTKDVIGLVYQVGPIIFFINTTDQ
jgi:hypothetical protein